MKNENNFIKILVEHTKYIYEEEKEQTIYLNSIIKIYFSVLTFTVGVVLLKLFSIIKFESILNSDLPSDIQLKTIVFLLSLTLLFVSFFLLLLATKLRKYERLDDPEKFVEKASSLDNEKRLLSLINANYVVAAKRNRTANKKKSKHLSASLLVYLAFLIFLSLSILLYKY